MTTLPLYQVDAFTSQPFGGNPAAVCVMSGWIQDELMQNIALENNLAETAFVVPRGEEFEIRWFTPTVEVDLCGHATLAAAHVLFQHCALPGSLARFHSPRSGPLSVQKSGDQLTLDFPTDDIKQVTCPDLLIQALGKAPLECWEGKTDFLLIYPTEEDILSFQPNFDLIASAGKRGTIISAPGKSVDFVSRFFAPQSGVPEDPVTGSAHTSLTPYWHTKLQKKIMTAQQVSKRKGDLTVEFCNERVKITGHAVTYMRGFIDLPTNKNRP